MPAVCAGQGKDNFLIRVAIVQEAQDVSLYVPHKCKVTIPYTDEVILEFNKNLNAKILPTERGISLDGKEYKVFGLKFNPLGKKVFYINNRPYKGEVLVFRTKDKNISVVNYLSLSDYLKGVLYNEVSHRWPMEVLKAQAITARTFAVYKAIENRGKIYDVTSGVSSQVYGGKNSERFRTNIAVKKTAGKILTYDNKILPSFYHACCGGYTEDSSNIWKMDLTVLEGRKDNFCKSSPYSNWKVNLSYLDIIQKFKNSKYNLNKILDIIILDRNRSERVSNLFILSNKGNFLISGHEFRKILGSNVIKSTNFQIKKVKDFYEFKGHGWGHGVGMCQWGAYHMARAGFNYRQILDYYYVGAIVIPKEKIGY